MQLRSTEIGIYFPVLALSLEQLDLNVFHFFLFGLLGLDLLFRLRLIIRWARGLVYLIIDLIKQLIKVKLSLFDKFRGNMKHDLVGLGEL